MMYPNYEVHHENSVLGFLRYSLAQFRTETAFRLPGQDIDYGQFTDNVLRVASKLRSNDLQNILISCKNPYFYALAFYAAVISGNTALLHDTTLNALEEPFQRTEIAVVLENHCIAELLEAEAEITLEDLPEPDVDAVCVIACSSGTTQVRKGIMLSQRNLCTDTIGGMEKYHYAAGAKYVNILPYFHLFGIVADLMGPLYSGGTICIPKSKFDFLRSLKEFKPTVLNAPPAIFDCLAVLIRKGEDVKSLTGGSLKKGMCAGAHLNEDTIECLLQNGITVLCAYGLTECSPCISMNRDKDYRIGSVGVPLDCIQVKIDCGEVLVRGDTVMKGYAFDEKRTAAKVVDGWLHTGDLGYLDEDGFLYITGRKDNLIVLPNGQKYSPEYYEGLISKIDFVRESLISSAGAGLSVTIVIECEDQQVAVEKAVKELQRNSCVPIQKVVYTTEPLPKNHLGKVNRRK